LRSSNPGSGRVRTFQTLKGKNAIPLSQPASFASHRWVGNILHQFWCKIGGGAPRGGRRPRVRRGRELPQRAAGSLPWPPSRRAVGGYDGAQRLSFRPGGWGTLSWGCPCQVSTSRACRLGEINGGETGGRRLLTDGRRGSHFCNFFGQPQKNYYLVHCEFSNPSLGFWDC